MSTQGGITFQDDGAMTVNTTTPTETNRHLFNTDDVGAVFLEFATSPSATSPRMGGIAYTAAGAAYATTAAVGATSTVQGGIARTATGVLHVTYSDFAPPSPSFVNGGVTVNGTGAVYVAEIPSFYAPLSDAGAGVVDTTLTLGTGPATFTRATAAWTKLSTGLWASVASGSPRSCYIGADTAVGAYGGYFAENAGTQLVTPTASIRDMTNAAWTAGATMTVAKDGVGIDGVTNSCSRLTGGAVSATNTAFQTLTAAASSRTYSVWLKRVTGTGIINITQDGGSTYTDVTSSLNTSTFTRVSLTASVLNAAFGIQVVTDGDVILADFNQFEAGAFATSPMAAAGAVRNADVLTYPFAGNASATAGAAYAELSTFFATGSGSDPVGLSFGTSTFLFSVPTGSANTVIRINDGTTSVTKSALTSLSTGVRKRAASWGGSGQSITGDGAVVATGAFDGAMASTAVAVGSFTNGNNNWFGTLKNVRIWQRQLPDAVLQAITA